MAKDPKATTTEAETLPPEDYKRAQESGAKDPVNKSVDPGELETMEDLGIGPRDPYPTGNPPEPPEAAPSDRAPPAPPVRSSRK